MLARQNWRDVRLGCCWWRGRGGTPVRGSAGDREATPSGLPFLAW